MTLLEWLFLILVYLATYGLWLAFDIYQERKAYIPRRRGTRRLLTFGFLTLCLFGLGATFDRVLGADAAPADVSALQGTEPGIRDFSAAGERTDAAAQGSPEVQVFSPPHQHQPEVTLSSPPPLTMGLAAAAELDEPKVEASPAASSVPTFTAPAPVTPSASRATATPTPAPAASPSPERYTVSVKSDPPGATLYVGGKRVGLTPATLSLTGEPTPYTVRAERGVPNAALYHPYTGTLTPTRDTSLSVWLERLSAAEVAALQNAPLQQPASGPDLRFSELRHVSASTVRYEVTTSCRQGVAVTYTNGARRIVQERGRKSGWGHGFVPQPGQLLYLYARSNCDSSDLSVQLKQNGEVLKESTATGKESIATIRVVW